MAPIDPTALITISESSTVDFIGVDHRLTLRFSGREVVTIETDFFLLRHGDPEQRFDPDGDKKTLGEFLDLFGRTVTSVLIVDGELQIKFDNHLLLRVPPSDDYEAWSYSGAEKPPTKIISMPGGELAIWSS